jgi:25S rRNA (cytosine2278-C5)-methyltransferase
MNFYFEAAKVLDQLNSKQGSIKGLIATLPEQSRKRSAALIIETLKCESLCAHSACPVIETYRYHWIDKPVLLEVMTAANLLKEERKLSSQSLALVLVHDLLLGGGIQAGDGPIKQAILRHKTRLHGEFQKLKIKRGVTSNSQLAQSGDERAGELRNRIALPWERLTAFTVIGSKYSSIRPCQYRSVDHRRSCGAFYVSRIHIKLFLGIEVISVDPPLLH